MIARRRERDQENVMKRRDFLQLSLGTAVVAALPVGARAEAGVKEIRVGYSRRWKNISSPKVLT
jgi:hypothetical protein